MTNEDLFNEWLDEIYPTVDVAGITFYPSDILKECDPIAYRCAMSDWESYYEAEGEDSE